MLVGPREIEDFPDERIVIISTGSQGEPLSALRRMAYRDHRQVELHERRHGRLLRHADPGQRARRQRDDRPPLPHRLRRRSRPRDAPVHASGHGYAEEVKLMLNLAKPRYVMPFHGDFKRLRLHAQLAEAVGVPPEDIFQGDNGLPLDIDERGARFGKREQSGMIFVDGVEIGDMADVALRDRRMLSADGIFIVVVTIAEQDGSSVADPEVIFRGVPFLDRGRRAARRDPRDGRRHARRAPRGEEIREVDLRAADAARRPSEAGLRPAQAAADGPARRRRGLRRAGRRTTKRAPLRSRAAGSSVDRAAVGDGHRLHDRKAQAERAAAVAGAAHEALEQRSAQLRRDARPVVLDDQLAPRRPDPLRC